MHVAGARCAQLGGCFSWVKRASADKIEELVDRCARYAEEIAVLQEKVNA